MHGEAIQFFCVNAQELECRSARKYADQFLSLGVGDHVHLRVASPVNLERQGVVVASASAQLII